MSYSIIKLDEKEEWHQILNQFPSYLSDIYFTPEYRWVLFDKLFW